VDIQKDDFVRINDSSEWHGLIGVCKIVNHDLGIAHIFCIQKPTDLYMVHEGNRDKVNVIDRKCIL
jgi:hypothetical protein